MGRRFLAHGREGGTIVGGGLAPIFATWLLSQTGHWWPVAAWMALTAAAGIVGVTLAPPVNDDVEASPEVTQVAWRGTALTSRPTLDKPDLASA